MLYLVGTPIGNLSDMSFRAVDCLKESDLIAAEDTRNTHHLLRHFNIKTEMTSYHDHNKYEKSDWLLERLEAGLDIALVSDAGMPGISDPGEVLVQKCQEKGLAYTVVPGPTALVTGVVLSGLSTKEFLFIGFLPRKNKDLKEKIQELVDLPYTLVFYEAPHRLLKTLNQLALGFGNRQITVARELTKKFEEVKKGSLKDLISHFESNKPRGEFVLVLEGKSRQKLEEEALAKWEALSLEDHLAYYLDQGLSNKEALKKMAKDLGRPKRELYTYFHKD